MCNLYLMYYTRSDHDDFKTCAGPTNSSITKMLPENSDRLLPPGSMEEQAIQYDNGHPFEETPKKKKKQFGGLFGGKEMMRTSY